MCVAGGLQQQKQLLADSLEAIDFPEGSTLFRCGDVGDRFYLIKEGAVLLSKPGDAQAPTRLTEGSYFGERSLIKDETRRAQNASRMKAAVPLGSVHALSKAGSS